MLDLLMNIFFYARLVLVLMLKLRICSISQKTEV